MGKLALVPANLFSDQAAQEAEQEAHEICKRPLDKILMDNGRVAVIKALRTMGIRIEEQDGGLSSKPSKA
jgi:hypothetical protein